MFNSNKSRNSKPVVHRKNSTKIGISGYQGFLRRRFAKYFYYKYQDVINSSRKKFTRRLFMDFNALIHTTAREVYTTSDPVTYRQMKENPEAYWISDGGISDRLVQNVYDIVLETKPKYLMTIDFDGVVTKAKMMQQRQRSYGHLLYSEGIFDPTLVKPGTAFMEIITKDFVKRLRRKVKETRNDWPARIRISDMNIEGEGEHKIMAELVKSGEEREFNKGIDVIYSPDSDMQVLTCIHSGVNDQTIVMRQTHNWKFLEPLAEPRWEFYDSTAIRDEIDIPIEDYVLIVTFAGNDFLPGLPMSMGDRTKCFDKLLESYRIVFPGRKGEAKLMHGKEINWGNLIRYLRSLRVSEEVLLVDMLNYQHSFPERFVRRDEKKQIIEDHRWDLLEKTAAAEAKGPDDEPLATQFVYQIFCELYKRRVSGCWSDGSSNVEGTTTCSQEHPEINFDTMPEMCRDYLAGLWWVMNYYSSQTREINVNWCYAHHYAPTVQHLLRYLEQHPNEDYTREPRMLLGVSDQDSREDITPTEHLLMILPREKLHLIHPVVKSTFLEVAPDLYPTEFQVDSTFVEVEGIERYSNEIGNSVILLNFPSLERVMNIFASVREHVQPVKGKLVTISNVPGKIKEKG